ncbi:MAG: hypothetical protein LBF09_03850 [Odoribacteraceae bacterium]|nr:hypothetical protein [Odoribacteraceae bacterium]
MKKKCRTPGTIERSLTTGVAGHVIDEARITVPPPPSGTTKNNSPGNTPLYRGINITCH